MKAIRFFLVIAAVAAWFLSHPVYGSIREAIQEDEAVRKVYRLTQTFAQSEIDVSFLQRIDSITPPFPARGPYQIGDIPVVPGRMTVHKFVALYRGKSAEGEGDFHDLLVIETDSAGTILNGYHYTLEWTDIPTLDLFSFRGKGVTLKDGLSVRELRLANVQTGSLLEEDGIIVLKK